MDDLNKINSKIEELNRETVRISNQSQAVETVKFMFEAVQKSMDSFTSRLTIFASVTVAGLGLGTIANGWYQVERISEVVESAKKGEFQRDAKLKEYFDTRNLKAVNVFGTLDQRNVLEGTVTVVPTTLADRIIGYRVEAQFPFKVSFEGSNSIKLNSYHLTFSEKFTGAFFDNLDELVVRESLNGTTSTNEINMVSSVKYNVSHLISLTKTECESAYRKVHDLVNNKDLGTVAIQPYFEVESQIIKDHVFDIKLSEARSVYDCDYLKSLSK
ncbi:hypothetical protein RMR21_001435 [Agrobacterium sp. rho-8.1]|nr:hypothetical protein [Agrobacterium sp. rho-8.1]